MSDLKFELIQNAIFLSMTRDKDSAEENGVLTPLAVKKNETILILVE